MMVRFVGPDDVIPRGFMTVDMPEVPRVGETVKFEGLITEQFVVREVWWPIHAGKYDRGPDAAPLQGVAQIPEVALDLVPF